jgi:hypothetical protein
MGPGFQYLAACFPDDAQTRPITQPASTFPQNFTSSSPVVFSYLMEGISYITPLA